MIPQGSIGELSRRLCIRQGPNNVAEFAENLLYMPEVIRGHELWVQGAQGEQPCEYQRMEPDDQTAASNGETWRGYRLDRVARAIWRSSSGHSVLELNCRSEDALWELTYWGPADRDSSYLCAWLRFVDWDTAYFASVLPASASGLRRLGFCLPVTDLTEEEEGVEAELEWQDAGYTGPWPLTNGERWELLRRHFNSRPQPEISQFFDPHYDRVVRTRVIRCI